MSMTEDEFEQIVILRERDFQMMGAAISNHNWHDLEAAYNAGRDRLDQTMLDAARWSWTLSRREAADEAPKPASEAAGLREIIEKVVSRFSCTYWDAGARHDLTQELIAALTHPAPSGASGEDIDALTGCADDQGLFAQPDMDSAATSPCARLSHEDRTIEEFGADMYAHLNCPCCGGSGHIDDSIAGTAFENVLEQDFRSACHCAGDFAPKTYVLTLEAFKLAVARAFSARDALATTPATDLLEQAARVADAYSVEFHGKAESAIDRDDEIAFDGHCFAGRNIAAAIRALSPARDGAGS